MVSLGEGSTPLLHAPRLSERLGIDLYLKWEGANPTGSFKDRGMTLAISKALEAGVSTVICASTGNTAASAAAYAARAGLQAVVLQPHGAVAAAKVAQAGALGARVVQVRGSFDDALAAARTLADRGTHVLVNSLNPYRIEGQKTAAFEIVEDLGRAPDVLALPYGGGGNIRAYARGFAEAGAGGPALVAGEAAERRTTLASAIRIAGSGSRGRGRRGSARVGWEGRVARRRADPPGVARPRPRGGRPLRALLRSRAGRARRGGVEPGARVVCVLTGHGLKDSEAAARESAAPVVVDADPDAIAEAAS